MVGPATTASLPGTRPHLASVEERRGVDGYDVEKKAIDTETVLVVAEKVTHHAQPRRKPLRSYPMARSQRSGRPANSPSCPSVTSRSISQSELRSSPTRKRNDLRDTLRYIFPHML